ncbi:MAG: PEP-CTERM sorting domain-containing protein [Chthoniobacterales bacterium]|nr:PEP-CTERM sorting domain-containing protein [Chthoniobacterales bacterium]
MKKFLLSTVVLASMAMASVSYAAQGTNSPYTDAAGDIDGSIATGGGTLDILGMEVTNNATDITFTLTLNGNISTTDWGNFMIGISTGSTASVDTGNGWNRPIELNSPIGGMDYWVGSWVNSGGGSQLWSYNGTSWDGPSALAGYSFNAGATSTITYTLTLASLGLSIDDVFYFDAYSSGGGGGDSAVDALANPNVSITSWGGPYTSEVNPGTGLNSYQVVPEPSTYALLALSAMGLAGYVARRRTRK